MLVTCVKLAARPLSPRFKLRRPVETLRHIRFNCTEWRRCAFNCIRAEMAGGGVRQRTTATQFSQFTMRPLPLQYFSRNLPLSTLPSEFLGSASTKSIDLGALYAAICAFA